MSPSSLEQGIGVAFMIAKILNSRHEAEEILYSTCKLFLGHLSELNTIHLSMDYPRRKVANSEPESILRLRKVFFHVQAIISWPVDTDILHVMGPDIRAAREQLKHVVDDKTHERHNNSNLTKRLKNPGSAADELSNFSHPNAVLLLQSQDVGGLGNSDPILCLLKLYIWLGVMVVEYGLGLGFVAELLDGSKQPDILAVINRVRAESTLVNPKEILQFADASDQEDRLEGYRPSP